MRSQQREDVLATMYHVLDVDLHAILYDRQGRPQPAAVEDRVCLALLDERPFGRACRYSRNSASERWGLSKSWYTPTERLD
jgi:hypothetical protein